MSPVPAPEPVTPGGGSGSLPIAMPDGITLQEFQNFQGTGTFTAVMMPDDTVVLAWGLEGDDFPRIIFSSTMFQDGINFSDGSYDPWNEPGPGIGIGKEDFGAGWGKAFHLSAGDSNQGLWLGEPDPRFPSGCNAFDGVVRLRVNSGHTPGGRFSGGNGAPGSYAAGDVGDIYLRADGGVGSTIYRCTTAGDAGAAVWTAIL